MRDIIRGYLDDSAGAMAAFQADAAAHDVMERMAEAIVTSMRAGGKLLLAGNGGSAGDAQHIAGEFTGRMLYDRPPLPAVALTVDSSALTAIANDYGYEAIFERQVLALGRAGDVFLGFSTSGNSPNMLRAFAAARGLGITCFGFTAADGGAMNTACDLLLRAPTPRTPVAQQIHITAGHIVCILVEQAMFPRA